MFRSADGKIRVDTGTTSVITDLASQQTILLDHLKQEAQVIPMPQMPAAPQTPGGVQGRPSLTPPPLPPFSVQDLGKGFIEGHEVEGKRYIMQPPQLPGMPAAPQMPQAPEPPTVSEVWTSTKLKMPVLTKTTGSFGEQVRHCRCTEMLGPQPGLFEVPPGYKVAVPKPPGSFKS